MPDKIPSWGYRPGFDVSEGKIFDLNPGEKLPAGWLDHPEPDAAVEDHAGHEHDIEVLREKATALGIEVDGRWGAKKLEKLIAAHEDSE